MPKLPSWLDWQRREIKTRPPCSGFRRKVQWAFAAILLSSLAIFLIWRIHLHIEIERRFEAIRAEGHPVSGAEYNSTLPNPSPSENGALRLADAFDLHHEPPGKLSNLVYRAKVPRGTNIWSSDLQPVITSYVLTNRPALALAEEALKYPHFRFPVDYSYGPDTQLPHLSAVKTLGRLATMSASLAAEKQDAAQWGQDVLTTLQLARALSDDPMAISFLVRGALISMAFRATEQGLNHLEPTEEICVSLQQAFMLAETNRLPAVYVSERAIMTPVFRLGRRELAAIEDNEDGENHKPVRYSGKPMRGLYAMGFFERDLNFYLKTMNSAIKASEVSSPKLSHINHFEEAGPIARKRLYIFSAMLLPALSKLEVKNATISASVRLVVTALAVERFRLAEHRLPFTLAELAPKYIAAPPIDPFDGQPLRYQNKTNSYTLYSVDVDIRDDQGLPGPDRRSPRSKTTYDLTFTVYR